MKKISFAPYLFDEYLRAVRTKMDADARFGKFDRWSEFKKPYLFDDHIKSERLDDPAGLPPFGGPNDLPAGGGTYPSGPATGPGGVYFAPGCTPELLYMDGTWFTCECDGHDCCVTLLFSCPDMIDAVLINAATFGQVIIPRSGSSGGKRGGVYEETRCGMTHEMSLSVHVSTKPQWVSGGIGGSGSVDRESSRFKATSTGIDFTLTPDDQSCVGSDSTCTTCEDCGVPVITYTTQQMSTNGTQALKASSGGGSPYLWSIIAGAGTLSSSSTDSGVATTYTAPSTNANCTNNPTIQVVDYCGRGATLQIAVNGYGSNLAGYRASYDFPSETPPPSWPSGCCGRSLGVCSWGISKRAYYCDNSWGSFDVGCSPGHTQSCTAAEYNAWCTTECDIERAACNANCPDGCTAGMHSTRDAAAFAGGCCPFQLL